MTQPDGDITKLLDDLSSGNKSVVDHLLPIVYDELRKIARNQMNREREGHTLSPTSLVHEAYLKLVNQRQANWQNRAHFFALALMSQDSKAEDLIMLDRALDKLKSMHERQAQIIEYKFFGGLEFAEIAEVLQVSLPTIRRDWRLARAWLIKELKD